MFRKLMIVTSVVVLALVMMVAPAAAQPKPQQPTIVEIALSVNAQSGEFSTLIAALSSAGLVDALNGKGQYTVFAPTDAAFAALGLDASNIGDLDTAALTNILLYHVANGNRQSQSVVNAKQIRMLNKGFVSVSSNADGVFVNSSKITAVDIIASNGVIHIIDAVLLP
jgi:uncharacterized surface protein with fasciclin (FAS1) repeats